MEFSLFPKLPHEIQLMVWECLLKPRIIHITDLISYLNGDDKKRCNPKGAKTDELKLCTPFALNNFTAVSPLSICHSSRQFCLSRGYKILLLSTLSKKTMLIMWNPEIDYIALQGRMDRFLLPENLSRYHPEFAAETRNLILYVTETFWHGLSCMRTVLYETWTNQPMSVKQTNAIELLTRHLKGLKSICFTEEPPAEWARGSDTFQSAGSQRGRYWRIFRPLIIPSQDSTNAAGGSFSPEVRFSQNDDSTLQGIYQVLDRKGKTHDLSEAIAKYQVHNQEKRQILE
ncbi:hypothetical protein GLAREA_12101 [Glarea lozoyensis ATCC 20868]|uniref:2EXR domain-containing protein n=1 Tax=Glarea lozoyensis (strain ATCC 20868 / MF5171) TaxID=1116229 RepID=S3D4H6_GLAL2|nr:uncharacterized protein GLAREA_12101 [Glarea lozoyensis ATCC 20868]EPE32019.1 hypothetical protein GLAREA_12101 [Glarea lozoyensis ATCC 20868]